MKRTTNNKVNENDKEMKGDSICSAVRDYLDFMVNLATVLKYANDFGLKISVETI